MGVGFKGLGGGLPVGGQPAQHGRQIPPEPVERPNAGFTGFGPEGGSGAGISRGRWSNSQDGLDADGLAEFAEPAVTDQLGPQRGACLLYTSPSPRDRTRSRMPSSA